MKTLPVPRVAVLGLALFGLFASYQGRAVRLNTLTPEQAEMLGHMSIVYLDDGEGGVAKTIRFTGVNVQVVNGLGATNGRPSEPWRTDIWATNGTGNLIVGYQDLDDHWGSGPDRRTGSHNLVVGNDLAYTTFGCIVGGLDNATVHAVYAGAIGGFGNTLVQAGGGGVAVGGAHNVVSGAYGCALGGSDNEVDGGYAAVAGGRYHAAHGQRSAIVGGESGETMAEAPHAFVGGGAYNYVWYENGAAVGGRGNDAVGMHGAVFGGSANTALGPFATIVGGQSSSADGDHSTVTGGRSNLAVGDWCVVGGGRQRNAPGAYDWVAGSLFEDE